MPLQAQFCLAVFRQVLDALGALTGSSDFRLALRRLEQAFTLEAERFVITEGSRPPDWQSTGVREAFPALAPLEAALRDNLALLEGYAAPDAQAGDQFGVSVAIGGDYAIVGAQFEDGGTGDPLINAGAAYIFR